MFKMGFWAQIANLTQLVNYRFNYYTLEHYSSTAELGKFSVATQISEGAWVLGRSNALIKYAEVSNTKDIEIAYKVIWNAKLVGLLTFGIMVIINLIPDKLFQIIFGVEFQAMQYIFLLISPGIIMLSVTMTISSFFSGIGRIYLNSTGSVIGLLITIPLSLWLVKLYGAMGAAIVCSVSYGAITLYSIVVFFSITKIPVRTILISKADFLPIYNWLKRIK
jgi:O-antigen/teichoic acid export membrane protein